MRDKKTHTRKFSPLPFLVRSHLPLRLSLSLSLIFSLSHTQINSFICILIRATNPRHTHQQTLSLSLSRTTHTNKLSLSLSHTQINSLRCTSIRGTTPRHTHKYPRHTQIHSFSLLSSPSHTHELSHFFSPSQNTHN